MRFAVVGEGLTDFKVLKNLLIGFFKDKNLPVTRFLPKDKEPVGWGNVLLYLSSEEFRNGVDAVDYVIVQIDTNECEQWNHGVKHIGDNVSEINAFIETVIAVLVNKIGRDFYRINVEKIIFSICVHEIECWLLPFNSDQAGQYSKISSCVNAVERVANKRGFSIHQKNYEDGKNYDNLSTEMKDNKTLLKKSGLNPSLNFFIETLTRSFSPKSTE